MNSCHNGRYNAIFAARRVLSGCAFFSFVYVARILPLKATTLKVRSALYHLFHLEPKTQFKRRAWLNVYQNLKRKTSTPTPLQKKKK